MAGITYPTTVDTFTTIPSGTKQGTSIGSRTHREDHNDQGDAIEVLEAKVGPGSSTPSRGKALVASGVADGGGNQGSVWDPNARKNRVINGGFRVAQRAMPTADNSYCLDRWRLLLAAASAATVAQETSDLPSGGSHNACKLTVGSGNNNKFGIFTILEGRDIWDLRGQTVSLQFAMKVTSGISDVRAAVVQWTGTEDNGGTAFPDPINAWGATATVPTYTGSWANANTPANLSPTTSWATYYIEGISISASATNLAVFVWSEDTTTTQTTDLLRVTDVQLELGSVCTGLERRHIADEEDLCLRYFESKGGTVTTEMVAAGYSVSTTQANTMMTYRRKRVAPTITTSADSDWTVLPGAAAATSISFTPALDASLVQVTVASGLTANSGALLRASGTTNARMLISAEL